MFLSVIFFGLKNFFKLQDSLIISVKFVLCPNKVFRILAFATCKSLFGSHMFVSVSIGIL